MGIILRHPWEFSETSIWGPEFYTKWLIMLGNDPTWSLECSHGRDQADGPGLRALIKAFFLILATVAVLEVGHADFRPICCPVSHRSFVVRAFRHRENRPWVGGHVRLIVRWSSCRTMIDYG